MSLFKCPITVVLRAFRVFFFGKVVGETQVSSQKWKTILHVQKGGPWFKNNGANESISFRKVIMENCKIRMGYRNRSACLSMVYPVMVLH